MKRLLLGLALIGTLVAVYFAPSDDGAVVAPSKADAPARAERTPAAPAVGSGVPVPNGALAIHPRLPDEELGNAFGTLGEGQPGRKKILPVQAQAAPVQASASTPRAGGAPPLPIHYLGSYNDAGAVSYFLQLDERNIVAHVGEQIDPNYRLDSVQGDTLNFVYLPLNKKQALVVEDTN